MKTDKKKKYVGTRKAEIFCICTLAFFLIHWIVFYVFQNFNSILLAFKKFDTETVQQVYLDLPHLFDNFKRFFDELFLDPSVSSYFLHGVIYHLTGLVALPISLMFAFVIYKKMFLTGVFKVVLYLPAILSAMVVALLFKIAMLDGYRGIWMKLGGAYEEFQAPLVTESLALPTLILYQFFLALPGSLLINVGTMSRVPTDLVEYGQLEGLSLWKEFLTVTVPLMFPVLQIYCLGLFSGFFTASGPVFAIYGDGKTTMYAPESIKSFGYYMQISVISDKASSMGDVRHNYGFTSAANLSIGLVSIPIIWLTKKFLDKFDPNAEF